MTKTINGLTVTTSAAAGDFVPIWRASNADTRKITKANFMGGVLTGAGTIATGGFTLTVGATSTITGSLVGNMTGGGTIATGGFTGTLPATGTFALLGTANAFTAANTFSAINTFSNLATKIDPGAAAIGYIEFLQNAVRRGFIGMSNGANALIPGTALGDLAIRATNQKILISADDGTTAHLYLDTSGNLGINSVLSRGKLDVDQSSTTAAIPTLVLDQADLSEEFIEFVTTVGAGNPIDTAAIGTYYGKARVNVSGVGYKYIALYNT